MTEQRRLAAIVSADVAGYSRLMGRDESGTLAALKSLRLTAWGPPRYSGAPMGAPRYGFFRISEARSGVFGIVYC